MYVQDFIDAGMKCRNKKIKIIVQLFLDGFSNRSIAKKTGASKNTIKKLRPIAETINGRKFTCGCGQYATHNGWCLFRLNESPKRQTYNIRRKTKL